MKQRCPLNNLTLLKYAEMSLSFKPRFTHTRARKHARTDSTFTVARVNTRSFMIPKIRYISPYKKVINDKR